ncbi:MAG: penicillin acylase family protein [Candidatus Abyssobacteria bacterium SURF_5]|uniref:Penicillin acylase family protein n=1 Tax=Abyssobacteria bacterium (strain SURF_5) TaxID=2093360 RepID=A0A3A4N207_ABYX5|nr:MAG: penicillin acylase family protein [Candidatus Abyssubacteria bacterium SURF_5]
MKKNRQRTCLCERSRFGIGPAAWFAVLTLLISAAFSAASAAADFPGVGEDAGKTVIYRDTWGVPHIYAPTVEAGAYAAGWAQAQDRPEELLKNFMRGIGESAKFAGPATVKYDLVAKLWDNYGVAERNIEHIRPAIRGINQAYVKGVNDYYAAHPEDVPAWWGDRKVDEYMVIAAARFFLYNWSIEQAFADLKRTGIEPGFPEIRHGSNQFAVAPSRSAEKAPILAIDPHLSWWGMTRFWEFRIHAGALVGSGVTLPGFPTIGNGHNEHIAWAMTTGGPDTADIYELKLNPKNPSQYLYDGEWKQMSSREIIIEVRRAEPQRFTVYDSHYGPVIAMRGGKAYAARMAYADAVQAGDSWYDLNFAKDYRGAAASAENLQYYPQNLMVADTSGNIYYQRVGRAPRRPTGYDWSRAVDGSTSATEWQGFHPSSDHVQILNPPQGYMQNCNIPPDVMMLRSPLTPDKSIPYIYSDWIYGPPNGWINQRGARALQLLAADKSVTAEEAISYILDVHPAGVEQWIAALKHAHGKFGAEFESNPDYAIGVKDLLAWDGELRRDSSAALKYYYLRKQLHHDHGEKAVELAERIAPLLAIAGKKPAWKKVEDEDLRMLLSSVAPAMASLKADFGSLDAPYGAAFRVGRDEVSWPVGGGGAEGLGTATLRNVDFGPERPDHTRWGEAGQTSTQIVVLSKPIRSWTAVPIGQSDRPESPHYRDQAEKLFSARKLKETWWRPLDLVGHIESRMVLEGAPTPAPITQ